MNYIGPYSVHEIPKWSRFHGTFSHRLTFHFSESWKNSLFFFQEHYGLRNVDVKQYLDSTRAWAAEQVASDFKVTPFVGREEFAKMDPRTGSKQMFWHIYVPDEKHVFMFNLANKK